MVEQTYIDNTFDKLSIMDVELDSNPLEFGPSALNEKTATVRRFLSNTERLFMEISQNLHKYKRDLLIKQNLHKISLDRLIAEDPHVRSGRSEREREALASQRLTLLTDDINTLTISVSDLDELLKVVKAKRSDLKDIQNRLRDQLKLCQEQIALGQRWGSRLADLTERADDLDEVFAEVLGSDKPKQALPSSGKTTAEVSVVLSKVEVDVDTDEDIKDLLNSL